MPTVLAFGGGMRKGRTPKMLETIKEYVDGNQIYLLPNAADNHNLQIAINEYTQFFGNIDIELKILRLDEFNEINKAKCLMVSGGHQSKLMTELGNARALKIKERINQGMKYIGTSAGAMVLGETCIYMSVGEKIIPGPGLGIIPELVVDVHFKPWREGRMNQFLSYFPKKGLGILDGKGVFINTTRKMITPIENHYTIIQNGQTQKLDVPKGY